MWKWSKAKWFPKVRAGLESSGSKPGQEVPRTRELLQQETGHWDFILSLWKPVRRSLSQYCWKGPEGFLRDSKKIKHSEAIATSKVIQENIHKEHMVTSHYFSRDHISSHNNKKIKGGEEGIVIYTFFCINCLRKTQSGIMLLEWEQDIFPYIWLAYCFCIFVCKMNKHWSSFLLP